MNDSQAFEAILVKLDAFLVESKKQAARFLSVPDAAIYCGIGIDSIRRLLSSGKLTALRPVKGRVVIDRNELDSFVLSSSHAIRTGRGRRRG